MDPDSSSPAGGRSSRSTSSAPSWRERLSRAFLKPPRPAAPKGRGDQAEHVKPTVELTPAEKAAKVRQVDPRERKFGYLGAALVAIVALLAFVPYVNDPSKSITQTVDLVDNSCKSYGPSFKETLVHGAHKCVGQVVYSRGHWLLEMLIVLFFAVFIFVAARIGRRSGLAFAALFAGLALQATTGSVIGLLFVFGGGWLLMRAWRVQRYGAPDAASARKAIAERSAAKRNGSNGSKGGGAGRGLFGRRRASSEEPDSGRKPPAANKRYTPKSPPRRRPPATS